MPYAGYCSFSQTEQAFQRGQEDKPFTIAMECELMPLTGDNLTLPLVRKGLAGEPVGLVCRSNSNNPIPWARVRFRNFSTSNIAGFYTSFTTTPPVTLGQKHLLILTYCGDKFAGSSCFKLYINSVSIPFIADGTMTESHEFENETTTLTIGGTNGHPNAVSRLTMWKRELTESEIALGSGLFDLHQDDKIVDAIATQGNGSIIYNALGSNHGTLTNVTLSSVWGTPLDTLTAWNQLRGYSLYYNDLTLEYLRVPYKNDKTPLVITPPSGFVKVGDYPAGDFWNNSEALFKFDDTTVGSDLYNADVDRLFFDVTGVAQWFSLSNVYAKNRGYWYLSTFVRYQKTLFTLYKTYKTGPTDLNTIKAHKMRNAILYSGKEIQYDEITGQVLLSW